MAAPLDLAIAVRSRHRQVRTRRDLSATRPAAKPLAAAPRDGATSADVHALLLAILIELGSELRHDENLYERAARGFQVEDVLVLEQIPSAADYHGVCLLVEPVITRLLTTLPDKISATTRRAFAALASRHRQLALAREHAVDALITAFAVADVPIILLKGAALAHLIYATPAHRQMVDIDILIDPADTQQATRIAKDLGYRFADSYPSKYQSRMHHLPVAETTQSGFSIHLEIHTDALAPDDPHSMTLPDLSDRPRSFRRGDGPEGLALGHIDMLRHLARHAFAPMHRIRLMHLYDLWRYQTIFAREVDWVQIEAIPDVIVALRLVCRMFAVPRSESERTAQPAGAWPAGCGYGMMPLSQISALQAGFTAKLAAVFCPPPWWLHGFYGIPPERSLLLCQTIRHPKMVVRWLMRRTAARLGWLGHG